MKITKDVRFSTKLQLDTEIRMRIVEGPYPKCIMQILAGTPGIWEVIASEEFFIDNPDGTPEFQKLDEEFYVWLNDEIGLIDKAESFIKEVEEMRN